MAGKGQIQPRWKKGQSGNPKGRPKMPDLREALQNVLGDEKEGKTAIEAILMALRKKALSGDTKAAQILLDRGYGSAVQNVALKGNVFKVEVANEPKKKDDANYSIPEVD